MSLLRIISEKKFKNYTNSGFVISGHEQIGLHVPFPFKKKHTCNPLIE